MRRLVSIACAFYLLMPAIAWAQPPAEEPDAEEEELDDEEEGEEPSLRPPTVEPLDVSLAGAGDEEGDEEELPDPEDAMQQLEDGAPPSSDPTRATWGAPQPTITLHGYYRVRPQLWDTFFLGRGINNDGVPEVDPPFTAFRPIGRFGDVAGGCGDMADTSADAPSCTSSGTLAFANMRLRVEPTIALSDDVKVHLQLDFLDNLVLGSTPDGLVTGPQGDAIPFSRRARTPRIPLDSFAATQISPSANRNSLSDAIRVRRAWAEVTNRGLGSLRFGRMGSAWGLGILANGGDGIDSDFQSDVDRIMAITKLAGFYLVAAWDFASEGLVEQHQYDMAQLPYDVDQTDDVNQWVFAAARRSTEEEQKDALQRGDFVLNGGAYFVYRNQNNSSAVLSDPFSRPANDLGRDTVLVRRRAEAFIPDVWAQFLWGDLRIEFEAALIAGSIQNIENQSFTESNFQLMQFGAALEMEYHLLEDQLGIYLNAGYASGDSDVDGLAITDGLPKQEEAAGRTDNTISTFYMHPNYRIDLILWRNIMTQIGGAYYIKPGLSYDFIKNAFGQLLGARADLIYSVASEARQTWGNDPNLGLEINGSLYYRSEDGPEIFDGFYANLQYGILFPLAGLGYLPSDSTHNNVSLQNAQIVRLILGVQY